MSPDHITAGAYNRDIDKRLTRKLVWLRKTIGRLGIEQLINVRTPPILLIR